jgi:signal transduction histidine kinase/CheY-like chemotaxis protein
MDVFLRFRNKETQKAYHQESVTNGLIEQKNLFIWILIFLVIGLVVTYSVTFTQGKNIYASFTASDWVWTWIDFAGFIVLYFLARKFNNMQRIWLFDLLYLMLFISTIIYQLQHLKANLIPRGYCGAVLFPFSLSFITQFWFMYIYTTQLVTKLIYITVYVAFVCYLSQIYGSFLYYWGLCYQCLFIIVIIYLRERTFRKIFLEKHNETQTGATLRFILDEIPESIMMLDKNLNQKFANKCCTVMFSQEGDTTTTDFFKRITDIAIRKNRISSQTDAETSSVSSENKDECSEILDTVNIDIYDSTKTQFLSQLSNSRSLYDMCLEVENQQSLFRYLSMKKMHTAKQNLILDCKYKKRQDSSVITLEIKISLANFYDEECMIFILRDTTQRDTIARLEGNSAYKDRVLASVSHELRTPLNGCINLVECALEEPSISKSMKDNYLNPAIRCGKLLMHLINDILDSSQIQLTKLRLVYSIANLKDTILECLQLVQLQAQKRGILLLFDWSNDIPTTFSSDHNRVSQIILNLLNNALKFTQKGYVKIMGGLHSGGIAISISDTGIGIKEEDKKRLFKAFSKIDLGEDMHLNNMGVGLGLSIANNLVKLLGPTNQAGIRVDSEYGKGTNFSFVLCEKFEKPVPCPTLQLLEIPKIKSLDFQNESQANSEGHCQPVMVQEINGCVNNMLASFHSDFGTVNGERVNSKISTQISGQKSICKCAKILIVDDDCFNVLALQNILKLRGSRSEAAYNGQAAIENVLQRNASRCCARCEPYQIIFMDCNMPIMDGFATTKLLRNNESLMNMEPAIIIGCTALSSEEKVRECLNYGMNDVIFKPINRKKVEEVLSTYLS